MRYEIEIHNVWLPVTREQAEEIFADWDFPIPGATKLETGSHHLGALKPGEECRIMDGHVRFRRPSRWPEPTLRLSPSLSLISSRCAIYGILLDDDEPVSPGPGAGD